MFISRDKLPKSSAVGREASETIKGFCKPYKKPDGWGGFVLGVGANKDTFIQSVLEWQEQFKDCLLPAVPIEEIMANMPNLNTVYLDLDL